MSDHTRSATALQACRHSREPFDCMFHAVASRRDLSPTAKLVHARLVSLHRLQHDETQTAIGEALGLSRHQVWAAIQELVSAGLVVTIRYGLGLPNAYTLVGMAAEDLAGRASRQQAAGTVRPSRARTSVSKELSVRNEIAGPREPGYYSQTRYGPLRRR